ncbi:MAG TPA: thioesterase family protein [Acidimicrobiales bacterium]|nr:thioesterase family protein [Acidimicrobiales bacterium]
MTSADGAGTLGRNDALPRPSDIELLGLNLDSDSLSGRFELIPGLSRHDGALYGGTGVAVSVAAMEAATGRDCLWVTTQYVSTTYLGSMIEVSAEVLASGRAISQVQVTGRHQGRVLFVSLGSTATPRPDGLDGQYETMPAVEGVEHSPPMPFGPGRSEDPNGFNAYVEYRLAEVRDTSDSAPPMALWARLAGGRPSTRAGIAFLADMVPLAIARAAGAMGGGPSLDNSLRFGRVPEATTWVLLELRGHLSYGAHAHGSVRAWSPQGDLVAVGSQSANMMHTFDPAQVPDAMAALLGGARPAK